MTEMLVPPHDLDAEAAVLSAIMLAPDTIADVAPLLSPDEFYSDANARIARAIWDLDRDDVQIDIVSVASRLRDEDR